MHACGPWVILSTEAFFQYFKKIPLSYVCEINRSCFFSLEEIFSLAAAESAAVDYFERWL